MAIAIRGLLGIVVGVIAFLTPAATVLALVLVAVYILVDGVFAIVGAVRAARRHDRWGLVMLEGIAGFVAAVIAVLWPGITVLAFMVLVAAWALVSDTLMVMAAFHLDFGHGRWWLILGGAASIAYGVLLLVNPLIGALALAWWFGIYAFVFGVALLIFALPLRAQYHEQPRAAVA